MLIGNQNRNLFCIRLRSTRKVFQVLGSEARSLKPHEDLQEGMLTPLGSAPIKQEPSRGPVMSVGAAETRGDARLAHDPAEDGNAGASGTWSNAFLGVLLPSCLCTLLQMKTSMSISSHRVLLCLHNKCPSLRVRLPRAHGVLSRMPGEGRCLPASGHWPKPGLMWVLPRLQAWRVRDATAEGHGGHSRAPMHPSTLTGTVTDASGIWG